MPLTKKKRNYGPPPPPVDEQAELIAQMKNFLISTYSLGENSEIAVKHLWASNFRVNIYEIYQSPNSIMLFHRMVHSEFVRVETLEDGGMHKEVINEDKSD